MCKPPVNDVKPPSVRLVQLVKLALATVAPFARSGGVLSRGFPTAMDSKDNPFGCEW